MREKERQDIINELWVLLEPVVKPEGLELIEIEFQRESRGWILRLYLDKVNGVTIHDCTSLSRQASDLLDVEDIISVPYTLEVTSPGLNRPLRRPQDFARYIGSEIRVRIKNQQGKRRNFRGKLLDFTEKVIKLEGTDGNVFEFDLNDIVRCNLVPNLL